MAQPSQHMLPDQDVLRFSCPPPPPPVPLPLHNKRQPGPQCISLQKKDQMKAKLKEKMQQQKDGKDKKLGRKGADPNDNELPFVVFKLKKMCLIKCVKCLEKLQVHVERACVGVCVCACVCVCTPPWHAASLSICRICVFSLLCRARVCAYTCTCTYTCTMVKCKRWRASELIGSINHVYKPLDRVSSVRAAGFRYISHEELTHVVLFELQENIRCQAVDKVWCRVRCIPMLGLFSAQSAYLESTWQAHTNRHLFSRSHLKVIHTGRGNIVRHRVIPETTFL